MTWLSKAFSALRPPPRLSLSQWADEHFYLSAESAAEPGRWRTLPYQRGILDAMGDHRVTQVSIMKSARVGATKMMNIVAGFHMHHAPCPIMVVQPTVEDAEGYSKEEIAPMLRDCPVLDGVIRSAARVSESTILHKSFPGGSLTMVGANSPRGFRRVSRRIVIFDEVDGYPASAGAEGDPVRLGIKRTEYYWDRKILACSTPTLAGSSRIETLYLSGDQRRYYVPCPHCGHKDVLIFSRRSHADGHCMDWDPKAPRGAHFVCSKCNSEIDHRHKRQMLIDGEWRAAGEFDGHASFFIWEAYSMSPNSTWGQIAENFEAAKAEGPEALRTFVNTSLGETWQDRGEAPDWERLYARREQYAIGTVPSMEIALITAGVDVQADRLVFEVVGWSADKQSWSLDAGEIYGSPSEAATWSQLDELLERTYVADNGSQLGISRLAIDSGYSTQEVYGWARRYPISRVMAIKGAGDRARALVGVPSPVDVSVKGRRLQRGYRVWPVGTSIAKRELYGWLRLPIPEDGDPYPPGWCHFPPHPAEYFRQLTAEQLITVRKRSGFTFREWHVIAGRQNHWLDARVYARAAASADGLDRARLPAAPRVVSLQKTRTTPPPEQQDQRPAEQPPPARAKARPRPRNSGWMSRRRDRLR